MTRLALLRVSSATCTSASVASITGERLDFWLQPARIAPRVLHAINHALVKRERLRLENAAHQLIHDDAVQLIALRGLGPHERDAARRERGRIDVALDKPTRAEDAEAAIAAGACFVG